MIAVPLTPKIFCAATIPIRSFSAVAIFYVFTIVGIFILRKKNPNVHRPYKAVGYPYLPMLYIIMGVSFCILLIIYKPQFTWPGLLISLTGIPLFYIRKYF